MYDVGAYSAGENVLKERADCDHCVGPILQEAKGYGISTRPNIAEIESRGCTGDARPDRTSRPGATTILNSGIVTNVQQHMGWKWSNELGRVPIMNSYNPWPEIILMHAAVAIDEESREFHIRSIELWTWHSSGTYIIYIW